MLVQVGSHDVLLDDALRLAAKAATDDVNGILDVIAGAPHVSQAFASVLEEAPAALQRVAAFIAAHQK
jgi:epsilon-lactone hydrolase